LEEYPFEPVLAVGLKIFFRSEFLEPFFFWNGAISSSSLASRLITAIACLILILIPLSVCSDLEHVDQRERIGVLLCHYLSQFGWQSCPELLHLQKFLGIIQGFGPPSSGKWHGEASVDIMVHRSRLFVFVVGVAFFQNHHRLIR
jgi:hypothetical protein